MEREVGGGIGMGNTCKPMAVSFQCMTKFTTNKKNKKKKESNPEFKNSLEQNISFFFFLIAICLLVIQITSK